MRNKTLLAFAIASCITAPLAFAQGRGAGGPPVGVGAIGNAAARVSDRVSDRATMGIDTASRASMQRTAETRTRFGVEQKTTVQAGQNQSAIDARMKADAKAGAKVKGDVTDDDVLGGTPNANAAFGQDTAARAKLQADADVETRKTFGGTQSTAAKARNEGTGDDTADDDGDK